MTSGVASERWRTIAQEAATLSQRVAAYRAGEGGGAAPDAAATGEWARRAAAGDPVMFSRRLQALGLTESDLPQCVAPPDLSAQPLAAWCEVLRDAAGRAPGGPAAGLLDPDPAGLPDLLDGLVGVAADRLTGDFPALTVPDHLPLLGDLLAHLQRALVECMSPCVDAELARVRQEDPDDPDPWSTWRAARAADGLIDLWTRYPALARLVGVTGLSWLARSGELLDRAERDLAALSDLTGRPLLRLDRVSRGLSDPHRGQARVVECRFATTDGEPAVIMYKPKDVVGEQVFAAIAAWMSGAGADVGRPLRVLAGAGYGWVEHVESRPVGDDEQAERYFRRCGALAALLYALGGADCTTENLIACGDQPVVVDAETILHPVVGAVGEPGDDHELGSVLDTLIPPRWVAMAGQVIDVSALSTADPERQPWVTRHRWRDAGTPAACLVAVPEPGLRRGSDLRRPDGTAFAAADHAPAILTGFDDAWRVLTERGAELRDGPLARLAGSPVRVIVRTTARYLWLRRQSMAPEVLVGGLHRSLFLEQLARYPLARTDGALTLLLADTERRQLEDGDVPLFTVSGGSGELDDPTGARLVTLRESAVARAERLRTRLTPADHRRQRRLLTAALAVAPPDIRLRTLAAAGDSADASRVTDTAADPLDAGRALVRGLADTVEDVAGGVRVVGLTAISPSQWGIAPLDAGYDDGVAGLALACCVVARVCEDPEADRMARALLRPSVTTTRARLDRLVQVRGLGRGAGVGGILRGWALCHAVSRSSEIRDLLAPAISDIIDRVPTLRGRGTRDAAGLMAGLLTARTAGWAIPAQLLDAVGKDTATQLQDTGITSPVDAAVVAAMIRHGLRDVAPLPVVAETPRDPHGDSLRSGIAGLLEGLRSDAAGQRQRYVRGIADLADRAVNGRLRLGVPVASPLAAWGLVDGTAGVMYALAASRSGRELPHPITGGLSE